MMTSTRGVYGMMITECILRSSEFTDPAYQIVIDVTSDVIQCRL